MAQLSSLKLGLMLGARSCLSDSNSVDRSLATIVSQKCLVAIHRTDATILLVDEFAVDLAFRDGYEVIIGADARLYDVSRAALPPKRDYPMMSL